MRGNPYRNVCRNPFLGMLVQANLAAGVSRGDVMHTGLANANIDPRIWSSAGPELGVDRHLAWVELWAICKESFGPQLGYDTITFNMRSALDCQGSQKLGINLSATTSQGP